MLNSGPGSSAGVAARVRYAFYAASYRWRRFWRDLTSQRKQHSDGSVVVSPRNLCAGLAMCAFATILLLVVCAIYSSYPDATMTTFNADASATVSADGVAAQTPRTSTFLSHFNPCPSAGAAGAPSADVASALQRAEQAGTLAREQAAELQVLRTKLSQARAASDAVPAGDASAVVPSASSASPMSFGSTGRCERLGGSSSGVVPSLHCHTDAHGHWLAAWGEAERSGAVAPSSTPNGAAAFSSSAPGWGWYQPMALLISAWERAQFDWHLLVPPRQAADQSNGELALDRLIAKEKSLMSLLLTARSTKQFGPGALSAAAEDSSSNHLFNPDLQYCPRLADKCVLHRSESECVSDGFCVWGAAPLLLCVSRRRLLPDGVDAEPARQDDAPMASLWPRHVYDKVAKKWKTNPTPMPEVQWPEAMMPPAAGSSASGSGLASSVSSAPLNGFRSLSAVALAPAAAERNDFTPTVHTFGLEGVLSSWEQVGNGWGAAHHPERRMQPSDCDVWIAGDSFVLDMGQNAGMFWHFLTEQLLGVVESVMPRAGTEDSGLDPQHVHFFFRKSNARGEFDTLWQWFHLHSLHCAQHIDEVVGQHGRVCFERLHLQRQSAFGATTGAVQQWVEHAIKRVGLQHAWMPTSTSSAAAAAPATDSSSQPSALSTVGFVSRQDKRILLNENELVAALGGAHSAASPASDSSFLPSHSLRIGYEVLPIHLQLAATRQVDILSGLHGSGLLNTIFMRSGTSGELQLVPPGLWADPSYVSCYETTAAQAGIVYAQMDVHGEELGVKHWHFAGADGPKLEYENLLAERGAHAVSSGMARIMFIQQDTVAPVQEFIHKVLQLKDKIANTHTK